MASNKLDNHEGTRGNKGKRGSWRSRGRGGSGFRRGRGPGQVTPNNLNDRRFNKVFTDPRFQALPEKARDPNKVQVDSRFKSMFTDPAFKTGCYVSLPPLTNRGILY